MLILHSENMFSINIFHEYYVFLYISFYSREKERETVETSVALSFLWLSTATFRDIAYVQHLLQMVDIFCYLYIGSAPGFCYAWLMERNYSLVFSIMYKKYMYPIIHTYSICNFFKV
jgi:hypothetical protein